jgi:two-component system sensor histidine kinase PilS (NtrC family)
MLLSAAARVASLVADPAALMSQAGLSGIGLFVVALLAGELSMRLAHEERTARDSRDRARQQAQLSRLVIEDMSDGVLVVDRHLRVRAANPAARRLLVAQAGRCPSPPFSLRLHPGWLILADEVEQAFQRGSWPNAPQDLNLQLEDGTRRALQMRARFTRRRSDAGENAPAEEPLCVLFIEELKAVRARHRQERLAAMGRISAGVAHEIRNPLAAIAQANALLEEDELRPDQRRLVRIMNDNIGRLRRIVDDVMEAAPGSLTPSRTLDANAEIASICSEWARTVGLALGSSSRLQVLLPSAQVGVVFDPDHLRRVLVNLLDNAARHATAVPGAVRVSLELPDDPAWVRLAVASDGAAIAADVEPYLFEPFHSTRSRGTGLGLYICRELCERHGARIDFRRHGDRHCNVFEVMMPRESLTSAEGRLVL